MNTKQLKTARTLALVGKLNDVARDEANVLNEIIFYGDSAQQLNEEFQDLGGAYVSSPISGDAIARYMNS